MGRWWGAAALAVTLSACAIPSTTSTTPPADPGASEPSATAVRSGEALEVLDGLPIVGRAHLDTYDRDAFGTAWADTDGNGCNQRDDVLLRDARPGTARTAPQGGCDHDVLAGSWVDPYTGVTMTFDDLKDLSQAQAIQIDHVVPLSEAWGSGADSWSDDQRRTFANDPHNLLAVDGPTNASKGDDDPAAWRPKKSFQCAYATRWISVKSRYDLAVDPSEATALREMLGYC